jgi:hypothetical protein
VCILYAMEYVRIRLFPSNSQVHESHIHIALINRFNALDTVEIVRMA